MTIFVEQIPNKPVDSNSFLVYNDRDASCIIIDPGTEDSADLIHFIEKHNLDPKFIILTHEHFDHIWGVNKIKELYNPQIVCSSDCAGKIVDKKKNMSVIFNKVGFETYKADVLLEDKNSLITWNGIQVEIIATQGHTNASVCILIEKNLFTGDTIIKNIKTVTKLPGGSKIKLLESLTLLNNKLKGDRIIIHSGHGVSFLYDELQFQDCV